MRVCPWRFFSEISILLFLIVGSTQAAPSAPPRYHSPSGRFDLTVETLPNEWIHYQKAKAGAAKESREQYSITLYVAKSSDPVNVIYYADTEPPPTPEELIHSMIWSPQEDYVVLADKRKAREGGHVFQLVAPTSINKVWSLEADHVQWLDAHRFVGDINTKEVPGGIMEFDGQAGKAELLIFAGSGIGYQIAAVSGRQVIVKEFLNHLDNGKTTWDSFAPSCFDLDVDQLKKRSTPCPP
jgi:hypothetical protein